MQINELIKMASNTLASFDTARLDSEIILAAVLNIDRAAIYAHSKRVVSAPAVKKFRALIDKRTAGCPVAYLSGHKEFWSLDFKVNQHTLIPRPETEHLVETALNLLADHDHPRILELGTGSGAVAIALAKEKPGSEIFATEVDPLALAVAIDNARMHKVDNLRFLSCSWFQTLENRKFDLIISNPPYIAKDDPHLCRLQCEPAGALIAGENGMEAFEHIVENAVHHLNLNAMLVLEHGCDQGRPLRALYRQHGYQSVTTIPDYANLDRVSFGLFTGVANAQRDDQ